LLELVTDTERLMPEKISGKRRRIVIPQVKEPSAGMWSNCYVIGDLVVIAGMVGKDENDQLVGPGDAYQQSVALFRRMRLFVEAAGGKMSDIIKLTAYLTDIRHRQAFIKARQEAFTGDFPPCVVVGGTVFAQPEYLVEVDAWAILGSGD
jgi:2-iminobutanoate/2-iminopropanoate deaminase